MTDALSLDRLRVAYRVKGRDRTVLRDVSLAIRPGEAYGLVGESGCGKSTAALAAVGFLPSVGRVTGGGTRIDGKDPQTLGRDALRQLRSNTVAMVYQDPGKALNPTLTVGVQVAEIFELAGQSATAARQSAVDMLAQVRISDPAGVAGRFPHQLSGGMQQRVVIAMALARRPSLLILDEPTTGLDATVEAEVLDLIAELQREFSTAILFISHNLGIVARMCTRVGVLYAGALVEEGPTAEVFANPRHPYTVSLLRCLPGFGERKDQRWLDTIPGTLPPPGAEIPGCLFKERCALARDRCREAPPLFAVGPAHHSRCFFPEEAPSLPRTIPEVTDARLSAVRSGVPVLAVETLSKTYAQSGRMLRAVSDVSLALRTGETLGLVGESGSGKTTLARLLLGLVPPDAGGVISLDGEPLASRLEKRDADQVKAMQIVFQNPDSALNRAHSVRHTLGRALRKLGGLSGRASSERMRELVQSVRLPEELLPAKPRQLSGGLKQRVAIARAFAGDPKLVVCDEPTSALDVSVQAAILNLLADLQEERGVSYVFISHDLGVVRYLSDRIAVLYLGRVMELGASEAVFDGPHHPYTEALLSAVPRLSGGGAEGRIRLEGDIPSAADPPRGCVFHTRCPRKLGAVCEDQEPELVEEDGHAKRCHISFAELARLQGKGGAPRAIAP